MVLAFEVDGIAQDKRAFINNEIIFAGDACPRPLILTLMVNQGGTRILDAGQAQAYLKLHGATLIHPDNYVKTNGCSLYYLSSGEVVLLPGDYSDMELKGIIFNDKKELEKCLEADRFPVENKTNDPVETNQHYIRHLDEEIGGIIKAMRDRVA